MGFREGLLQWRKRGIAKPARKYDGILGFVCFLVFQQIIRNPEPFDAVELVVLFAMMLFRFPFSTVDDERSYLQYSGDAMPR